MPNREQLLIDHTLPANVEQAPNRREIRLAPRAGSERQRGFTMVELMIAMLLSLFLLGAITYVVVNSNKNYNTTDSLSRLQENARFAMAFITADVRRASNPGCSASLLHSDNDLKSIAYGTQDSSDSWVIPMDGVDDIGTATTWSAAGLSYLSGPLALIPSTVTNQTLVSGSDALAIRYYGNDATPAVAVEMDNESADVVVENIGTSFKKGDIVAVTNCDRGDIFQVTDVSTTSTQITLSHKAGVSGITPGNQTDNLKRKYGTHPSAGERRDLVYKVQIAAYYVATNNTTGQRSLYRDSPADGNKEIVEGIDSLQVTYGTANPPPTSGAIQSQTPLYPTSYRRADQLYTGASTPSWTAVRSVRFGILASSIANTTTGQYGTDVDTGIYTVNDNTNVTPPAGERRLRRVFENTVILRN